MTFKNNNEFNPGVERESDADEAGLERPKSDGIRKKTVNPSFIIHAEAVDPHEQDGIIITEPVTRPSKEDTKLDSEYIDLKKTEVGDQDPDDTFSFSAEILKSKDRKNNPWKGYLIGGIVAILGVFLVFSITFSRVTITLRPHIDSISLPATIVSLDSSIDRSSTDKKIIPAERLEFDRKVSVEFESTGREYIEEKAKGKVKIYNSFSSSSQNLVAGTRFLTDRGLLYRLSKTVVIPGAKIEAGKIVPQVVEVELWADEAGEEGNLNGEVSLKIPGFKDSPKYEGFYALAVNGFAGGFKGEARVVSQDDLRRAEELATKKLYEELRSEMTQKIEAGFKTIEGLREIEIVKLDSPGVKSKYDRFSVEATGKGTLLIFKESDLVNMFKELTFRADKAREYIDGSAKLGYQVKTVDLAKGRGEMVVSGSFKTRAKISEKELAELMVGKKEGSIAEILKSRRDISSFGVAFFPPWLSQAPADIANIKLIIKEE